MKPFPSDRPPAPASRAPSRSLTFLRLSCLIACLWCASAGAQVNTTSYDELSARIKAPNAVTTLGPDLFGDKVNLYNGKVEFVQIDVSLPGNDALPVMAGRRLVTGESSRGKRAFGWWDLEIPHLHGMFSQAVGWRANDSNPGARCSKFGQPPAAKAQNNKDVFEASEFWHGHFMYIPGVGDQQLLIRDPANTLAPGAVADYPAVTAKGWSVSCLGKLANDATAGEGFLAIAPDGTQYRFDQMVSYAALGLTK